jgi:hypothetical protein
MTSWPSKDSTGPSTETVSFMSYVRPTLGMSCEPPTPTGFTAVARLLHPVVASSPHPTLRPDPAPRIACPRRLHVLDQKCETAGQDRQRVQST